MRGARRTAALPGGLAAFLLTLSAALSGEDLPAAPDGFSWKRLESVKASFLLPDGWHLKEEVKDGTKAFFLTREDIDAAGQFETGLTINVQRLRKDPAPARAARFIAAMMKSHEALDGWTREEGVLKEFGCRVRQTEKGRPPTIVHLLAVANEKTNTLYILLFESPEKSWSEAWAKGEVMLKEFFLDDEV